MITPFLEKLILTGRAQSKTFTASSQKAVISVPENHFIIIHHFSHFPFMPVKIDETNQGVVWRNLVTQMRIFSEKGFTNYIVRNDINIGIGLNLGTLVSSWSAGQPYQENVYLIHETDVSISFSRLLAPPIAITSAIAPAKAPARPVPADYGRTGFAGSLPVATEKTLQGANQYRPLGKYTPLNAIAVTSVESLEYPINAVTAIPNADMESNLNAFPVVNIQYLEIKGRPHDLAPTN